MNHELGIMDNRQNYKIYAFIDSQNLNLGVKSQGWNLDFTKFRRFLKDKYQVENAFLFIGFVFGNQTLYTELQKAGYICIFKPTFEYKKDGEIHTKGNVDAELVLHTMIEYNNYDKAVIVSGDGDFHCLIEYLVKQNKLRKIIVPNIHFLSLLRKFSSLIVNIQLFRKKVIK
ncbi:MAG TPA: NYN domain-containing protein [Candidatus Lokiarchaeia archaeon]